MSNVFEYLEALRRFHLVNCFLKSFPTHRTAMQRWNRSTAGNPRSRSLRCQPGKGTHARALDSLERRHSDPKALSTQSQKLKTKQLTFESDNDKTVWNVPPHLLLLRLSNPVCYIIYLLHVDTPHLSSDLIRQG